MNHEREPARAFALVLEEVLMSPNTFKELLAAAEQRRKGRPVAESAGRFCFGV